MSSITETQIILFSGGTDSDGCARADFCNHGEFCPVQCDHATEMHCSGQFDYKTGKQTSADTCVPMKNGDCHAHCPVYCNEVFHKPELSLFL